MSVSRSAWFGKKIAALALAALETRVRQAWRKAWEITSSQRKNRVCVVLAAGTKLTAFRKICDQRDHEQTESRWDV